MPHFPLQNVSNEVTWKYVQGTAYFFVYSSQYFGEVLEYFTSYCVLVCISLTNPSIHTFIYNQSVYRSLVNICLGLMLVSQYMQFSGSIFIFKD